MKTYTIYKATNLVNNKVYIGFTANWPQRISGHDYDRRYGQIEHKPFYKALKKYGWDNFVWEAIYQSQDEEHTLKVMEPQFITEYRSWVGFEDCNGYNVTMGGEGATGYKRTPELIESHRKQLQGRKQTAEHIAKRVESLKRNPNIRKPRGPMPPEFGQAISRRLKGKPKSEEHKKAMRNRPQDTARLTCPHCGKEGDYKNMKRWHMDNCKAKK
jgi:group I intron endonuclease